MAMARAARRRNVELEAAVALEEQQRQRERQSEREAARATRLREIIALISEAEEALGSAAAGGGPQAVGRLFEQLRAPEYVSDYQHYELARFAPAMVRPLVKSQLAHWRPLTEPERGAAIVAPWVPVLRASAAAMTAAEAAGAAGGGTLLGGGAHDTETRFDAFEVLLTGLVVPMVRSALIAEWDPVDDAYDFIHFWAVWEPLLPTAVQRDIIETGVLPRLQAELSRADTAEWLLPLVPILPADDFTPLLPGIARALTAALAGSGDLLRPDAAAVDIVEPWVAVLGDKTLEDLVERAVLPQVAAGLEAMDCRAGESETAFARVVPWAAAMPRHQFVTLLERSFFPPWLRALRQMLAVAEGRADRARVAGWYEGWRHALPDTVVATSRARDYLQTALQVMAKGL